MDQTVYIVTYEGEVVAVYSNKDRAEQVAKNMTAIKDGDAASVEPWAVD